MKSNSPSDDLIESFSLVLADHHSNEMMKINSVKKALSRPKIEEIYFFYYIVHPNREGMLSVLDKVKLSWTAYANVKQIKLKFVEVEEFSRMKDNECIFRFSTLKAPSKELKIYDLMPRQFDLCFGNQESLRKYELDQIDLTGKFMIIDMLRPG